MKLAIGNKYNLKLYIIPESIEDTYLIKYHSPIDNEGKNIIIVKNKEKLIINSNLNMNLYENDRSAEKIELKIYKNYKLIINDTGEELYLYCLPNEMEYQDYAIEKTILRIGQSPSNEISLKEPLFKTTIVEINKIENEWFVKSEKVPVYINKNTSNNTKLNYGDELFIGGLKLIWMKGFVRLNYLPNCLIYIPEFDINKYKDTYKKNVKLQEFDQKKKEEAEELEDSETIVLENPPLPEKNNELYYFIALGASFTLAITSLATLLTVFLSVASKSSSIKEEKNLIIISVFLIFCSIIFPFLIKILQKSSNEKKEGKRILLYSEYLKRQKETIANFVTKKANYIKRKYPSSEEWQKRVLDNTIWNRDIDSDDFLTLRFGTGDIQADINIDSHKLSFTYENPILKEQLNDIQNYSLSMKNTPIPISLTKNSFLPIIIKEDYYNSYIEMLLLQLISFHNNNLKLVFLVSEENCNLWNNYKFLPHVDDNQNEIRFFAYDKIDTNNIINYLEEAYQNRIQKLKNSSIQDNKEYYTSFNNYYLIITDRLQDILNYEIINKIISGDNYGFSLLSFERHKKYIEYKTYIEVKEDIIVSKNIKGNGGIPNTFKPDFPKKIDIYNIVKKMANLPVLEYNSKTALPKEISLLDLYKVGKVEQLNILDRWEKNNTLLSLGCPIGATNNNEIIEMNLHEHQQGPNCLISGMVGSGKLELLKTYITSMCINYSPKEVQFILIDYKNAGLVKTFKNNLPHIVGTMTELEQSELYRFYIYLNNEINKRKELFTNIQKKTNEITMNIYKYQKLYNEGIVSEKIPHLFIICYEYFELYTQHQDYLSDLLNLIYSASYVGIHLILCTQKPSEVLNNQILNNSKLKISLKVQSLIDSEKVLNRREAASISNPGRFYYEVGYNESFKQVQGALGSSFYNPQEVYSEKIDDTLNFITNSGIIYKEANEEKVILNKNNGSEIDNICKYILTLSKNDEKEILYLPSLEENLSLSKIIRKYNFKADSYRYKAIIGEYDKPSNKEQSIFTIDLETSGNVLVYGLPGSGKTNHLLTILFSICLFHSPKDLNVYILDDSKEELKSFGKMPQVGEYISDYEEEKAEILLEFLNKEIDKRKTSMKSYNNSFIDYNTNSPYNLPLILIAIKDYKKFILKNNKLEEQYNYILKEGSRLGIIFITTAIEEKYLTNETKTSFHTMLGTQFADQFDYRYLLDAPKGLVPKKCFGRGLAKINGEVVEYQCAFIAPSDEIDKIIVENAIELKNNYKTKVKPLLVKLMTGGKKHEK